MIEKLEEEYIYKYYGRGEKDCVGTRPPSAREIMGKTNELIQYVNVLYKALTIVLNGNILPPEIDIKIHTLLLDAGLPASNDDIIENKSDNENKNKEE